MIYEKLWSIKISRHCPLNYPASVGLPLRVGVLLFLFGWTLMALLIFGHYSAIITATYMYNNKTSLIQASLGSHKCYSRV
jgi:hypothetical protein